MGVVIRQSIKATIVNYIGVFIAFITTMFVMTYFLTPEEVGLTRVVYEAGFLIAGFAQLGISASAMRFFPYFKDARNRNNGFFFYLLIAALCSVVFFTLLYVVLREPISDYFSHNSQLFVEYYNWVIPLIPFLAFCAIFETYSNLLMRIVVPKLVREVIIRVLLLLVYLAYAFDFLSLDGLVIGTVFTYGVAMLINLCYVARIGGVSVQHNSAFMTPTLRREIGTYMAVLVVGAVGSTLIPRLDLFMVSSGMGLDYAGIYTIAFYIASVIDIPSRSITAISSPIASEALKKERFDEANALYKKVALHQYMAGATIFLLIWINIDNLFAFIPNGEVYAQGKWVVFFVSISRLIYVALDFGGTLISFSRYYYWKLSFSFFLIVITIYSNYMLIPRLGMAGAAIATLICTMLSYAWQQWIVLHKIKGNPYSRSLFKLILLTLLIFGANYLLPIWSENPIVDGLYRTSILGAIWCLLIYRLKLSEEVNRLVRRYLPIK